MNVSILFDVTRLSIIFPSYFLPANLLKFYHHNFAVSLPVFHIYFSLRLFYAQYFLGARALCTCLEGNHSLSLNIISFFLFIYFDLFFSLIQQLGEYYMPQA